MGNHSRVETSTGKPVTSADQYGKPSFGRPVLENQSLVEASIGKPATSGGQYWKPVTSGDQHWKTTH